ncbi:MAG: metal ABC transporter permease [Acetobacteraceae bacterium]|jgi:manganese/zinc/iron transport system permease protein|nr:metal ABC transporter permease [Acetobacteraceae bacterium]
MSARADFLAAATLTLGHNASVVVLGCAAFGLAAGLVGTFVLLRGRALIADVAAHATLPGVAAAFIGATLLGLDPRNLWLLMAGGAATAMLGALAVRAAAATGRVREDAAMALTLSAGFGLGVVLMSVVQSLPTGGQAGLSHFILGQAAGMAEAEAWALMALALAAVLAAALLFNPLRVLCFDEAFAAAVGLPVRALDLCLTGLMLLVTVAGLRAVGLILVVALMVIPAVTARLLTERLSVMAPLAALLGAAAGWLGTSLSAAFPGLPTGAIVTLVACIFFLAALMFSPRRGVLAAALGRASLAGRIARDHFLRGAWEELEGQRRGMDAPFAPAAVAEAWGWSGARAAAVAFALRRAGLVAPAGPGFLRLTEAGLAAAQHLVRRHRVWELYLTRAGGVRAFAAHRGADLIEHTLPPEVEAEVEAWLAAADPETARLAVPPPVEGARA